MKLDSLIRQMTLGIFIVTSLFIASSCEHLHEDLPECRLFVRFKYDYNMLSADAFHSLVDKVELYVFDKDGKFLFKQSEEGPPLSAGNYLMEVNLPTGQYKFMAWAGVHRSYDIASLKPGESTITELKLKLKRDASLIINKKLEPLWYGEIIDVNITGTTNQTEVINLIKDTNKVRFVFRSATDGDWNLNMDAYDYEIIESNGYLDYDNSLLKDDIISYRPYYMEQKNSSTVAVELNTMRLMADREIRFVVTEKAVGQEVFNIDLMDFLSMTETEGHNWSEQEYLDRQDEYVIVFFFSGVSVDLWQAVQININGWTYYLQTEGEDVR